MHTGWMFATSVFIFSCHSLAQTEAHAAETPSSVNRPASEFSGGIDTSNSYGGPRGFADDPQSQLPAPRPAGGRIVPSAPGVDPVTDFDGYTYQTVQIGDQVWMAENLRSIHYSDGAPIESLCYQGDPALCAVYGRLYSWSASMRSVPSEARGACPEGWHIPSDAEWQVLIEYLGGESVAGGKLKVAGTQYWQSPNQGGTNESHFNALPAGFSDFTGQFLGLGEIAFFRTSSAESVWEVYIRELSAGDASVPRGGIHPDDGVSIRCVKDPLQ